MPAGNRIDWQDRFIPFFRTAAKNSPALGRSQFHESISGESLSWLRIARQTCTWLVDLPPHPDAFTPASAGGQFFPFTACFNRLMPYSDGCRRPQAEVQSDGLWSIEWVDTE